MVLLVAVTLVTLYAASIEFTSDVLEMLYIPGKEGADPPCPTISSPDAIPLFIV